MTEEKKSGGWKLPLIIGLLIGGLVLTFVFQNSNEVQVKFLMWEGKAILSYTYFIVFAVTILAAVMFGLANWYRRGKMKRKITELEATIEEMKTNLRPIKKEEPKDKPLEQ